MNKPYIFVNPKQYQKHSEKWLKWLNYDESVVIIFPYLNDRAIRLKQFTDMIKMQHKYNPIIFDPGTDFFDEYSDLVNYVASKTIVDLKNIMVVPNADMLLLPQNIKYFEYLERYRTENITSFNTLLAFESNYSLTINTFFTYTLLFQNQDYYPLYDQEDMDIFISTCLSPTWDISVPGDLKHKIIQLSGGSFWLAKEAVRIYRDTGTFDPSHPSFTHKLDSIAKTFNPVEIKILLASPRIDDYKGDSNYTHLSKLRFLDDKNSCTIPSLREVLHNNFAQKHLLHIKDNSVYFDQLNVSLVLSRNENAILKGLLSKPNTPFSRDDIAELIWQENSGERYSQWAIDQAAKRLRDKLVKLGLPASTIKSVRGIGYEYRG